MSTRCTIKYERDESTGQEINLYEDLLDDPSCMLLELEGFTFETSVSVAPSAGSAPGPCSVSPNPGHASWD
jgi:hypothetical protein